MKKKKGGYENVKSWGQGESTTSERLGQLFHVSESTIKRDAKFAEGITIIARSNPKLKSKILVRPGKSKKG